MALAVLLVWPASQGCVESRQQLRWVPVLHAALLAGFLWLVFCCTQRRTGLLAFCCCHAMPGETHLHPSGCCRRHGQHQQQAGLVDGPIHCHGLLGPAAVLRLNDSIVDAARGEGRVVGRGAEHCLCDQLLSAARCWKGARPTCCSCCRHSKGAAAVSTAAGFSPQCSAFDALQQWWQPVPPCTFSLWVQACTC